MTTATTIVRESRRRRMLLPLATMLAAAGIAAFSGATFTASTAAPVNIYASGTMELASSNTTIFNAENLQPGQSVTGDITVQNTGSLPAALTLTETVNGVANPFTAGVLDLTITEGGAVVYAGDLGQMPARALGTWAAGASRDFVFTVTLESGATNVEQGKSASVGYTWSAEQAPAADVDQTGLFHETGTL